MQMLLTILLRSANWQLGAVKLYLTLASMRFVEKKIFVIRKFISLIQNF